MLYLPIFILVTHPYGFIDNIKNPGELNRKCFHKRPKITKNFR